MLIARVELRNIKNHAEAEFSFQPGVIAICGPNGSGKTTILEAIAWVLFDHLDYKRDDFVKRGARKGQVVVNFISNLDGREYVVTRDTGGAYFVYDPVTKVRLIEQKNQVVPWLRRHIGVEPGTDLSSLFKTTIGVPQGTFTYDFTLAPSNRKSVFDQVLKVEEYRKASDNLRETIKHVDGRIVEADRKLAQFEGELKVYDEVRRDNELVESSLRALEGEHYSVSAQRDAAARELERLNNLQKSIDSLIGSVERLAVKLELSRASIAGAREAAEQAQAAAAIVEAARKGYEEYLGSSARLADLEKNREARDARRQEVSSAEKEMIEARTLSLRCSERLAEAASARQEIAGLAETIQEQESTEVRLAELREARGELTGLKRSLESTEREIEKLRNRYSTLSRQVEIAESWRDKALDAEELERERSALFDEIRRNEMSLSAFLVKREQLEALRKEQTRLSKDLDNRRSEIARLEPMTQMALSLGEMESRQRSIADRAARLRAELARDRDMISALDSGGLCPLLTEKCLNLKPGESLDARFRSGLKNRAAEIEEIESSHAQVSEEVRLARSAAAEASRLEQLRVELIRLGEDLDSKSIQFGAIADEIESGGVITEAGISKLKDRRSVVEQKLRESRDAEKLFSQAMPLRAELELVQSEGEARKKDNESLSGQIASLGDVESLIAAAERGLASLNDTRGRAALLNRIVSSEEQFKRQAETADRKVDEISANLDKLNLELRKFESLDADISGAARRRSECERDYQAYIANEMIALTAGSRHQEVAEFEAEIERLEQSHSASNQELKDLQQGYDAGAHRSVQAQFDEWREKATQISAQLDHTRERFARLQSQLEHLNAVRELASEILSEKAKTERLRETADFIRDTLLKAAPFITESYLLTISNEANQLYREITGRFDVTLKWSRDYEITLEEEGRERPFLSMSGGEQMAAALSVRLALLKELSEINLAFFDEPTANMDEERRSNLAQQIGRIKDFQQLFVISHDDSFEGYTDQIIMLGERKEITKQTE
ncbi:MAG: SMC family ATPase [Acidobacteria bacterium]|nr:SMC family ATPase [Acidobacteriota bacterium]